MILQYNIITLTVRRRRVRTRTRVQHYVGGTHTRGRSRAARGDLFCAITRRFRTELYNTHHIIMHTCIGGV